MLRNFKDDVLINAVMFRSECSDEMMLSDFLQILQHLYKHSIFKNMLDIVVTKCSIGQLKFRVHNAKFFDLDAGNCLTMVDDGGVVSLGSTRRKYVITIKKVACDVVVHEIAHMLEKELSHLVNLPMFASTLMYEVNNINQIHMKNVVKTLFVDQVSSYPESQHMSELFARFFQFFAGTNEVAFQSSLGERYRLQDAINIFPKTLQLLDSQLASGWRDLIDPEIARRSSQYVTGSFDTKEQWADRRIKSSAGGSTTASRWGIKSNKTDPFK